MALTKAELSEKLYEELGINRREAREFIDLFFNEIIDCLSDGYDVKISGFGNFILRNKSARPGRNPKTGEPVAIPQKKMPFFKMGKSMKERINS